MENLYDDINELLKNTNISLKITELYQLEYIFDLVKSDEKICCEFNDILYNICEMFISIKYSINGRILYYMPYNTFESLTLDDDITLDELYQNIKVDIYRPNCYIEGIMEDDDIIYEDIMNYIENNNILITGLGEKLYYTDNYLMFKDKYLILDIIDIIKSDREIDEFIELCNMIKEHFYFSEDIKKLFADFIHYEKFKSEKANIIKNIIFN
jgi:hypothetical protein